MSAPLTGALLMIGRVMHERVRPKRHRFVYPACYVSCDIAQLDAMQNAWPLSIRTHDYGPRDGSALEPWMRARLANARIPADGDIRLLTIPRVFGYAFNPVSFWFCYDRAGALRALYADVRNTFGARRGYLLSAHDHAPITGGTVLVCRKTLHVSPFCDVQGHYAFRVRRHEDRVSVSIDYHDDDGLLIRTAIGLKARPLTRALAVIARIHWQALLLWTKRVPFYGKTPPLQNRPRKNTNELNDEARP